MWILKTQMNTAKQGDFGYYIYIYMYIYINIFFFFLAVLHGLWDLRFPTRD